MRGARTGPRPGWPETVPAVVSDAWCSFPTPQWCAGEPGGASAPSGGSYHGPAGAFAQEYTVIRNTLFDNKLSGHEKSEPKSHICSDCTIKMPRKPVQIRWMGQQKPSARAKPYFFV